jgi:pimeloyl-ACP methyl ester carboxylesterase
VLFGSCGGAVTSVRAAEGDERVRAVVGYALPVVLTGGRGAALAGRGGMTRVVAMARLGLGEAVLRASRGRLLPSRLAPWLNVPVIRALRVQTGDRPTLLLFGGEDDVQDHLARYGLERLRGVEIDELAGIGHHFDDPEDVERVAAAMDAWLGTTAQL